MTDLRKYSAAAVWLWLGFAISLSAQSDRYLDKVTLTNGTVIWGISEIEDQGLRIYISPENSVQVPDSLIKSLKTQKLNPSLYLDRATGVYYQFTTGILIGKEYTGAENQVSFSGMFTSGYRFKRAFGIGLGAGVNFYSQQRHIPLFFDIQGDLLAGRFTPYYQLSIGSSWAEERETFGSVDRFEGGFYLRPAVGAKWHFPGYSWYFQISYHRQGSTAYYQPVDLGNGSMITNVEKRVLQRMGLSVGIEF